MVYQRTLITEWVGGVQKGQNIDYVISGWSLIRPWYITGLDLTLAQTTLAHGCLGPYIRANFSLGPISFWPKSHFGQSDFDPGQFGPWTLGPKDILAHAHYGPSTFGPMDVRAYGP